MIRLALASMVLTLTLLRATPSDAQTFVNYTCDDGTPLMAAFFTGDRTMRMQLAGKPWRCRNGSPLPARAMRKAACRSGSRGSKRR